MLTSSMTCWKQYNWDYHCGKVSFSISCNSNFSFIVY